MARHLCSNVSTVSHNHKVLCSLQLSFTLSVDYCIVVAITAAVAVGTITVALLTDLKRTM
jgi:hypothetical protein